MTPDEIYVRAVAAARAEPIPALLTYRASYAGTGAVISCTDGRIVVSFENRSSAGEYRVSFRSADAAARSVDDATGKACSGAPLIAPSGAGADDVGDIRGLIGAPSAPLAAPSATPRAAFPNVASVHATNVLHYRVESAAIEPLDDTPVYHLVVRALADPVTYPLTDLYVDTKTFLIRRMAGTFADTYGGVPATIRASGDFAREGDYWVETSEHVAVDAPTVPKSTRATLDARAWDFSYPARLPDLGP